jgi:hypothetical protein
MLYSITVQSPARKGDNEALLEALSIIRAKPLVELKRGRQWIASTPYSLFNVRRLLDRSARGDVQIEIVELPQRQTEAVRELLDNAG